MQKAGFLRARVWVLVAGRTERPSSSLPSLKRRGRQEEGGARIVDHGCAALVWPAREVFWGPEGRRDLVISFFSPRIRADMSAALVDTEEN